MLEIDAVEWPKLFVLNGLNCLFCQYLGISKLEGNLTKTIVWLKYVCRILVAQSVTICQLVESLSFL